jgi:hypothetical protein
MNITNLSLRFLSLFALVLIIPFEACEQGCPTSPTEVTGDHIFVERIIITDAVVLAGDSTMVRGRCVEPSLFYDFYPDEKRLEYQIGPIGKDIPANNDLKVILGDKHFYLPPYAGCGGGTISLSPIMD